MNPHCWPCPPFFNLSATQSKRSHSPIKQRRLFALASFSILLLWVKVISRQVGPWKRTNNTLCSIVSFCFMSTAWITKTYLWNKKLCPSVWLNFTGLRCWAFFLLIPASCFWRLGAEFGFSQNVNIFLPNASKVSNCQNFLV